MEKFIEISCILSTRKQHKNYGFKITPTNPTNPQQAKTFMKSIEEDEKKSRRFGYYKKEDIDEPKQEDTTDGNGGGGYWYSAHITKYCCYGES